MNKVNNINIKFGYIGVTIDPKERWDTHKSKAKNNHREDLYKAMRKRGLYDSKNNPTGYKFKILWEDMTRDEAKNKEKELISNLTPGNNLNMNAGGSMPFTNMYDNHRVYGIYWNK